MATEVNHSASILVIVVLLSAAISTSLPSKPHVTYRIQPPNFTNQTASNGYLSEEHSVTTEDGYILGLFRIVKGKNCNGEKRKTPVLLMHGLLESSDAWIDAGPNAGLAYLISDACFDIWVGNVRGNYYSRKHKTLDPDKHAKFWRFSVDEIGLYDVPAMIDYILKHTGEKKMNYIGFSQGGGIFFVMCSERPGYCDKIKVMIGLAPATRHWSTRSPGFRISALLFKSMEKLLKASGVEEVLRKGAPSQQIMAAICQLPLLVDFCDVGIGVLDFYHQGSMTDETVAMMFKHFPAGTSVQNMARYGQSMINPDFVKFDHGRLRNIQLYGTSTPPRFNLSAATAPVVVIYGKNDGLVDSRDVKWLVKRLPRVIDVFEVKDPLWNHMDVNYSKYTRKLIFPKIYEHLNANS